MFHGDLKRALFKKKKYLVVLLYKQFFLKKNEIKNNF